MTPSPHIVQRIEVQTRHLTDLFRLPCITKAYKAEDGKVYVVFESSMRRARLTEGDAVLQTDGGEWLTEMSAESYEFNSRIPRTLERLKPPPDLPR